MSEEQPQNELVIRIQPNEAIYYKVGERVFYFGWQKPDKIEQSPIDFIMVSFGMDVGCFFKVSANKKVGIIRYMCFNQWSPNCYGFLLFPQQTTFNNFWSSWNLGNEK